MAMTKKEQAELQALRDRDVMLRAIAYPTFARPVPMAASKELQHGFSVNIARVTDRYCKMSGIDDVWRDGKIDYPFDPVPRRKNGYCDGGSCGGGNIYATEQEAARELAYQAAEHFGSIMANIYAKCF